MSEAHELIKALTDGKRLIKDYKLAYPGQNLEIEPGERLQTIYLSKNKKTILCSGYGAVWFTHDLLLDEVFSYPERFTIEEK